MIYPAEAREKSPPAAMTSPEGMPSMWSDALYRSLVDSLQDGLAILRGGIILFANPALGRMLGCPAEELVGRPMLDLVAPQEHEELRRLHRVGLDGDASLRTFEIHLLRQNDRQPLPVQARVSRFIDIEGEVTSVASLRDLSQQEQDRRAAEEAEQKFRSIFENAVEGIYQTTPDGSYINVNPAMARIYGYDGPDDLKNNLTDIARQLYVDASQRNRFRDLLAAHSVVTNFEAQVRRKDGAVIWITENARCVRAEDGTVLYYEGTVEDITERKAADESLRLAAKVFDTVSEAIIVAASGCRVQTVNAAFEQLTGQRRDEIVGNPLALLDEDLHGRLMDEIEAKVLAGGNWQGEVWMRRNGGSFPAWLSATGVRNEDGAISTYVILCSDISQRKESERRIRYHAERDTVTQLLNRRMVMERLHESVERARQNGSAVIALFIDLDRFKFVNDSFGHAAGDRLLQLAARRLSSCVRLTDVVGRIGGDEFVILLPDVEKRSAGMAMIHKILYAFSDPFTIAGREIFSTPSIGVAVYPDDAGGAEELLSNADAAMYHAKKSGGRSFCFFRQEMTHQAIERLTLENELRAALQRQDFRLHYQPKFDQETGRIIGAEALMRWHHPVLGDVSPARFIPIAEQMGLLPQLGAWTLREACRQMRAWRDQGLNLPSISVNLSPAQFHDSGLLQTIRNALTTSELEPEALDLEITETTVAQNTDKAVAILREMRAMGMNLSVDDFGTGYSSLSYLKTFPINCLKIDRSFVQDLPHNEKDGAIISSVMALAANLGFQVVAEGVETEQQAAFLKSKGCRFIQGYLFSRPLPPESFSVLFQEAAKRISEDCVEPQ
ncbi:bifunctional diguanylate cyclase/phosphodiesterase [Telmatospirillum sp. J64-1]|uniref:sensor domain-containing protein n=1 Tax=Telmatospirillum sp. J64-1 TaxID=2502183 RepID=UPI00163D5ED0|nr:bifunctional diguanylate cyclase/phosphodiesterase [Telmatospirillum sp. J64-1]